MSQNLTDKERARLEREWEEVKDYRDLLEAPDKFDEGFTIRTIIGVLFISLIMTPGEMYLGLVTGGGIGSAAQWVTVILFLEVAKRSFTSLKRQEIYLLVYVAGALVVREEGAFLDLLWRQYFVRSPEAEQFGLAEILPFWWAPGPDSEAHAMRTFIHPDWAWPIGLLVLGTIVGRISWFTSGYLLFRLTSDREQLPFPTAPMAALGSMALAEESGDEVETWKWPIFSVGAVIGGVFGSIYVGLPTVTEMLGARVELIPIPFADFTPYFGNILPATPLGITVHLGPIFAGLLMPFWSVIGAFSGVLVHTAVSPILYDYGLLPRWVAGSDTINTMISTGIDFWRAFSIGIILAVTLISFYQLWATLGRKKEQIEEYFGGEQGKKKYPATCQHEGCNIPSDVRGYCVKHLGRGDFNIWLCIALFSLSAIYPILLAKTLFPTLVGVGLLVTFALIAFVYAPIMSFVSARLDGLIGREVSIPYINEAIIFLTGYRGVDVWFVPFPTRNYGGHAEGFRVVELVGMRFTSLLKAEVFMLPIVLGVSLMYWTFLWRLAPIPSESYPYAQRMWPLRAFDQALFLSSTMYNTMWRAGESLDDQVLSHGQVAWSPSNLQDGYWWYWRVRATREHHIPDELKRIYGPWSEIGYFYTDFKGGNPPRAGPDLAALSRVSEANDADVPEHTGLSRMAELPAAPELRWPLPGAVLVGDEAINPNLRAFLNLAPADSVEFYVEIDQYPSFDGSFLQRSADNPMMYEVLWYDVKYTGDQRDNDGDGLVDEEVKNGKDDDGDGTVDENDFHHPLEGKKWKIILIGTGFGLIAYFILAAFGMPIFLIWGYVNSVTGIPHMLLPQIIGALLARYYFWKRYGKQQWRRYAMVLSVGFGVGMALVGMFCAALAMISKAVSTLSY